MSSKRTFFFLKLLFLLSGCASMERSEKEKMARANADLEAIERNSSEVFYALDSLEYQGRAPYPWEAENALPKITKSFFRCRGSVLHPEILLSEGGDPLRDCSGSSHHGLPILGGKEDVYPILLELLNFVQKKTGKRVLITCGHRCPTHNTYADPSKKNLVSKHQIGAEVDFYVQGMEEEPEKVVSFLLQYFKEDFRYAKDPRSREFLRRDKGSLSVAPWVNKEVVIRIFQKNEGRDWDNQHDYPYVSIEVLYDRSRDQTVQYSWAKAHQGYPRL